MIVVDGRETLKLEIDNTNCQYCGRVCGTKALRYKHEKVCPLNPKNKK